MRVLRACLILITCVAAFQSPLCALWSQHEVAASDSGRQWTSHGVREALESNLQLARQFERVDPKKSALHLRESARLHQILGSAPAGITILQRALALAKAVGDVDGEALASVQLSYFHITLGNRAESESFLASGSKLLDRVNNTSTSGEINFYIGEILFAREDLKFVDYYHEAVRLFRNVHDSKNEARTLFALSYASVAVEALLDGQKYAADSVALWKELGDSRGEALALSQLGSVELRLGRTQDALSTLKRAEVMFPPDIDLTERAILEYNIGKAYEMSRDCEGALNYYGRSLELLRKDRNSSFLAGNLWTLGAVSFRCGDSAASFSYLDQALALARQLGKTADELHAHIEIGRARAMHSDLDIAERHFRQALQGLRATPYTTNTANALLGLGDLYERRGHLPQARESYRESLLTYERIRDNFARSEALFRLARVELRMGDPTTSLKQLEESIHVSESLSGEMVRRDLQRSYFVDLKDQYDLFIKILMTSDRSDERPRLRALIASEQARARSIRDDLHNAAPEFHSDADADIVSRAEELRAILNGKSDRLADLLGGGGDKSTVESLDAEISELRSKLEEISAELKQKSPVYSAIKDPPQFDLADFQSNVLNENDVLLEYFLGKEESYLWLVGKNEFEAFVLPGREVIETKVDELRGLIESRKPIGGESLEQMRTRVGDADSRYAPLARELSDMILGPVADKLAGKRLIVVPDGKLHYFSISALPLPNSESDEPLLLTNEVVYQPSAQTLSLLTKFRSRTADNRDRDLLVFSDPVFSRDDARLAGIEKPQVPQRDNTLNLRFAESLEGLQRLPASGHEAETITSIVGRSGTDVFYGFGATRDNLLSTDLSHYKIIHLATHGLISQDRPELSSVVLSRFDEHGRPLDESVRLQDIYAMKLNADLVVLSACQTAAGKEIKGEGVMGLNNAFLQTGARSVVASLWQVEDNATNILMREFYSGMARGLTVSSALREAQLTLYRDPQFRSPFFWAAFTLQGDMNRKPDIGSSLWIWWLAAIPAILLAIVLLRRRIVRSRAARITRH